MYAKHDQLTSRLAILVASHLQHPFLQRPLLQRFILQKRFGNNVPITLLFVIGMLLIGGCTLEIPSEQLMEPDIVPTAAVVEESTNESAETGAEAGQEEQSGAATDPASESTASESTASESTGTENENPAAATSESASNQEQTVVLIPLPEALSSSNLEISAMDWYGDHLVMVPQFPERYGNNLFAIERQQILDVIDGTRTDAVEAKPIPFNSGLLRLRIPRQYGGFEAIAFTEDRVYLAVEAGIRDMAGYIVAGTVASDLSEIVLDYENYAEVLSPTGLGNMAEETLLVANSELLTIYEANGVNVNPAPVAHRLDTNLAIQGTLPLPNIEYRITDATRVDEEGRFWAINYFYPGDGDKLQPIEPEPLSTQFGKGPTHEELVTVERLVEFQIGDEGITLTGKAPIQLELFGGGVQVLGRNLGDEIPRNWEGIARLDDRGFLIATDKFPDTLLGFVPFPK